MGQGTLFELRAVEARRRSTCAAGAIDVRPIGSHTLATRLSIYLSACSVAIIQSSAPQISTLDPLQNSTRDAGQAENSIGDQFAFDTWSGRFSVLVVAILREIYLSQYSMSILREFQNHPTGRPYGESRPRGRAGHGPARARRACVP